MRKDWFHQLSVLLVAVRRAGRGGMTCREARRHLGRAGGMKTTANMLNALADAGLLARIGHTAVYRALAPGDDEAALNRAFDTLRADREAQRTA